MIARPWYGGDHKRLRKTLIESGLWIGQPCSLCGEPMWPGQKLDLGHACDAAGRSIPGRYTGLQHSRCNQGAGGQVNPWGVRTRAAAARAARSPQRVAAIEDAAARKTRKQERAEWDRVQAAIAADGAGAQDDEATGRDW